MLFRFDTSYIFECYNYCEKVECTTPKSSNYCFPSLDWNQFHYFRKLQFPLGTTFNQKLDTLLLASPVIEIFLLPYILRHPHFIYILTNIKENFVEFWEF